MGFIGIEVENNISCFVLPDKVWHENFPLTPIFFADMTLYTHKPMQKYRLSRKSVQELKYCASDQEWCCCLLHMSTHKRTCSHSEECPARNRPSIWSSVRAVFFHNGENMRTSCRLSLIMWRKEPRAQKVLSMFMRRNVNRWESQQARLRVEEGVKRLIFHL